jgi:hypothetical protein
MPSGTAPSTQSERSGTTKPAALLPLVLSVKRRNWREENDQRARDTAFQAARNEVLRRDGSRCRYCALRFPKWLEVHHMDDDHSNNESTNLVTACSWCHGVHHIGHRGTYRLGILAIHPEWPAKDLPPQWKLHHLLRAMLASSESYQDVVNPLEHWLYHECTDAVQGWLPSNDPAWLGDQLLQLSDGDYRERERFLKGFRLLPLPEMPPELDPAAVEAWQRELTVRKYWTNETRRALGVDWVRYARETE